jgi:hypothetical protein
MYVLYSIECNEIVKDTEILDSILRLKFSIVSWQRSMCFAATGWLQGWAAKLLLARWQSPGILRVWCKFALQLTARR